MSWARNKNLTYLQLHFPSSHAVTAAEDSWERRDKKRVVGTKCIWKEQDGTRIKMIVDSP